MSTQLSFVPIGRKDNYLNVKFSTVKENSFHCSCFKHRDLFTNQNFRIISVENLIISDIKTFRLRQKHAAHTHQAAVSKDLVLAEGAMGAETAFLLLMVPLRTVSSHCLMAPP